MVHVVRSIEMWILSVSLGIWNCCEADEGCVDRLDVYVPKATGLKPVVLFVHGGVWSSGDKWQFSPLGSFLAEEGVVAVLVQYTLYPKVSHLFSPLVDCVCGHMGL